jgi:hypothetical protein
MSTLIYLTDPVTTRNRRRCFRIEIENPNNGDKKVSYHQEDITEDTSGNEVSKKQVNSLSFNVSNILNDIIEITDPITGIKNNISGAAIALWLEAHYVIKATAALTSNEETQ